MAKKELKYAEALAEVEKILSSFENEQYDIDALAAEVKRATELIRLCKERLHRVEADVARVLGEEEEEES